MSPNQHLNPLLLLDQAVACHRKGQLAEAERLYLKVLELNPGLSAAYRLLGFIRSQQGRNAEALELITAALKIDPNDVQALYDRGNALQNLGRFEEAIASYDKALVTRSDYAPGIYNSRGNTLRRLGRLEEALASYDKALAIKSDYAVALCNRGTALQALKRPEEALSSYDRALAIRPDYAEALNNRGNVLSDLERFEEALSGYDKALALRPSYAEAFYNRGNTLRRLNRLEAALASYDQALAARPDYGEAFYARGGTLHGLNRFEEALASYDKSVVLKPNLLEAFYERGNTLHGLRRFLDALTSYDRVLAIWPDHADTLYRRGVTLQSLGRLEEASTSYEKAIAAKPEHAHAFAGLANAALWLCDWKQTGKIASEIESHLGWDAAIWPQTALGYSGDASLQFKCAKAYLRDAMQTSPEPLPSRRLRGGDKIRIAYLSSDFREHAVAYLLAELIERHDRSRFEILGFSFGHDDRSAMRARLVHAFDRFYDVHRDDDARVAGVLNSLEVEIAVDLNGYTGDARPRILAHRPVPVQVSYLGYPGTMAADFIDYIIADKIVLPFEQQPFFAEKIVHLPNCYLVSDSKRMVAARALTRSEFGLPEQGFVFCCFNNHWKITAAVFDVWMRLLRAVEGSVLWLSAHTDAAMNNLRKEAAARGIDPHRLVFAARMDLIGEHLARHRLADLFLDTLPYNAHTTASDALWAGLPLITCRGASFAGRVAASLLCAIGLPELVTSSLEEYERLALKLATTPSLLEATTRKLERNRLTSPLFDGDLFRGHIETAYTTMSEICRSGQNPRSFSVEAHAAKPDPM